MKRRELPFIHLIVVLLAFVLVKTPVRAQTVLQETGSTSPNYVHNEVLVKFTPGTSEAKKQKIRDKLGAQEIGRIKSIGVEHWKLPEEICTEDAVDYLQTLPIVEYAEPNYMYKPMSVPNDQYYKKQWYLRNTAQRVNGAKGIAGADISAVDAWDIETGSSDIVIAVIDSGVAFDHPDLKDNIWTNEDEIPGNGIDDDHNGYVDDIHGWDFVNDDNNPSDYSRDLYGEGHGTHVAGIIAATGNNGKGITGVMWKAQIMPLQVFDIFKQSPFNVGSIWLTNLINAIDYAVQNGARIINLSLEGPTSQALYSILQHSSQRGVLVVVAAGNGGFDGIGDNNDVFPSYPASYDLPNIISVAATNEGDELASYSNYGATSVDVAAPGGNAEHSNIYSTVPPERVPLFYDNFESGGYKWITWGKYEAWSVTWDAAFGSNVIRDSYGYYHANEELFIRTVNKIDASNCRGIYLQFSIAYELDPNYDFLYVEWSRNDIVYSTIEAFTGFSNGILYYAAWSNELEFGKGYLRFSLKTDTIYNYNGVFIDNILVTGIPWMFDGDEYDFKSGTSMAAPVVCGIAGLIWSHNPSLTHLQVKEAILKAVDKLPSLSGKVLSEGRVNAYKALLSTADAHKPSNISAILYYLLLAE